MPLAARLALLAILTRILTAREIGQLVLIQATAAVALLVFANWLQQAYIRISATTENDELRSLSQAHEKVVLSCAAVAALACAIAAVPASALGVPAGLTAIAGAFVVLTVVVELCGSGIQAHFGAARFVSVRLLQALLTVLCTVAMLLTSLERVTAVMTAEIISLALVLPYVRHGFRSTAGPIRPSSSGGVSFAQYLSAAARYGLRLGLPLRA